MEKCKYEIKKIINNYKKMEKKRKRKRKKKEMMTWTLTWLNVSAAALNAMLQLLVIY